MHLFYQPDMTPPTAFLPEEESRHCVKVLRLPARAEVMVVDGRGGWYCCEITRADPKRCELRVLEYQFAYGKRPYRIHVAIAPTKNADRLEWFVEKSVEIGIDELSLIICEHSERRSLKPDRLEKIAVGAMKQSLKAFLPVIHEAEPFANFLQRRTSTALETVPPQRFIAYVDENVAGTERSHLQAVARPQGSYTVLIGPEGDFSSREVAMAMAAGFQPVSLGNSRLRTETAGLVACHVLHVIQAGLHASQSD